MKNKRLNKHKSTIKKCRNNSLQCRNNSLQMEKTNNTNANNKQSLNISF